MYTHDGKLKKQSSIDKWEDFKNQLPQNAFEYFKENHKFITVLINIKQCFNITPITLKTSNNKDIVYYRELALYLLVNYSNAPDEEIIKEFSIQSYDLKKYKDKEYFEKLYKKELELYFKDKIDDFTNNRFSQIHFWDSCGENLIDAIFDKEEK